MANDFISDFKSPKIRQDHAPSKIAKVEQQVEQESFSIDTNGDARLLEEDAKKEIKKEKKKKKKAKSYLDDL